MEIKGYDKREHIIKDEYIGDSVNPLQMLAQVEVTSEEWEANKQAIQFEILKQLKRIADKLGGENGNLQHV